MRHLVLTCAAAILLLTGCTRPPDIVGIEGPAMSLAAVPALTRQHMFLMTTREASVLPGEFFSSDRSDGLALASVDVTIPPNHVTGGLERATELPPDPLTEFTVVDPAIYTSDAAFVARINAELAQLPPQDRRILIFIHGYNNTTSDAILRVAQFVEDSGYRGVPVLFTWASAANVSRYVYDLNSALAARSELKTMADILRTTNTTGVDLFAHSMGAFLAMEGLVDAQLAGRLDQGGLIDTIMLASPDIDIDVFRTQIELLPQSVREKMFLLISEDDGALRISRRIAGGVPRVGSANAEELEAFGLTLIDLSEIEDSSAGSHSKFTGSPEVVQLIGAGLNSAGNFGENPSPGILGLLAEVPITIIGN